MSKKRTKKTVVGGGSCINISGPEKQSLDPVIEGMIRILSVDKCGDEPKREAMVTLRTLIEPMKNVTIQNCSFVGK